MEVTIQLNLLVENFGGNVTFDILTSFLSIASFTSFASFANFAISAFFQANPETDPFSTVLQLSLLWWRSLGGATSNSCYSTTVPNSACTCALALVDISGSPCISCIPGTCVVLLIEGKSQASVHVPLFEIIPQGL